MNAFIEEMKWRGMLQDIMPGTAEQLDKEIAQKTWIVAPENTEIVFQADHTHLWHNVLHGMGDTFKVISHFPEDPRLN